LFLRLPAEQPIRKRKNPGTGGPRGVISELPAVAADGGPRTRSPQVEGKGPAVAASRHARQPPNSQYQDFLNFKGSRQEMQRKNCPEAEFQGLFSMSDCDLTTVCSSGKVWKADRNRQPARDSTATSPSGASARRWCG